MRGLYFEGWRPAHKPDKSIKTQTDWCVLLERNLGKPADAHRIARATFHLLDAHVSRGEIDAVKRILPHEIRELWS